MLPVMLDVRSRSVLVVGGGPVAARKAASLAAEGAVVTVVAPVMSAEMVRLETVENVQLQRREFDARDLVGCWLIVTATDDPAIQQRVYNEGSALRIWVNSADDPARCSFILPAVHRDGPVVVAVSTEGASPALAGWLRSRLAKALPADVSALAAALSQRRQEMRAQGESTETIDWLPIIEGWLADRERR